MIWNVQFTQINKTIKRTSTKMTYLQSHWNIISVSLHIWVPAIGQRPLFSAPDHSGRRITFSLAVELSRLAQPDRHILWLQQQHRFGCRGREQQVRSNMWHLSMALIGETVWVFRTSRKRVVLPPSTDRRAALLSLTPTVLLATQT